MKRKAPILCTKQAIFYLFITFDKWHLEDGDRGSTMVKVLVRSQLVSLDFSLT